MSSLSCAGLGVRIGSKTILSDLDLTLEAGRVTVLVGPNGAGKSTLLSCLAGLRAPAIGMVALDGVGLTAMRPRDRARRIAFLPQTPEVAWPIQARTLVELGRTPFVGARGLTQEDRAAVARALRAADIETLGHRIVDTLSGGERARVLIARALAGDPEWLLADEPLTGLDPAHQLDAVALFRRLAEAGAGVITVLHDLSLALRAADRVIVMAEGGVLADGAPQQALRPDILKRAFGVEARLTQSQGGALIDVIRRAPPA